MNDQSGTAQLRFLEETAIRLLQNGFTAEPIEDHHLPVCWEKGRLCRISGRGSVLYRQECVDSVRAQDALQSVIDTAKTTSEYMAILETAPRLKASGLDGDYRVLADFSSAVLAGHPTERGVQFVTWEWDFDREGVHHGHYFQDDYETAKRDFTVRSGLVQKDALFEPEQLAEIYRALAFVREQDETLSFGRDQELAELMDQVGGLLPPNVPRRDIYAEEHLSHREKAVYIYLRDRADASGVCWPGIKTIARELGLSPRTVQRALADLERRQLIEKRNRRRSNGSLTSNLYRLTKHKTSQPPAKGGL